jgi:hypothetical protein
MYKNATKYYKTQSKWCKNNHGASKIIDTFETYQSAWDNTGLIAALNNLYQQGGWVMDSGATSNMTNDKGTIFFLAPLSLS